MSQPTEGAKAQLKINYTSLSTKRKRLFERLQTTHRMTSSLPKNVNIFKARAAALPDLFKEYNHVLEQLEEIQAQDEELHTDSSKYANEFEDLYFTVLSLYEIIVTNEAAATASTSRTFDSSANTTTIVEVKNKLPELQLPTFDGTIGSFATFKAMFDALVHQATISDVEKFSYLIRYLQGPALELVKTVEFKPENYQTAYDLLVDRYTNARIIAQHYLNKLLNLQPSKSDSASRQLADTIRTTVAGIKSLTIPDLADFLLLHLSLRLLDTKTRKAFEDRHVGNDFPTFAQFTDFLRNQGAVSDLLTEQTSGNSAPSNSGQRKKVLLANQSGGPSGAPSSEHKPVCACCSSSSHKLSKCERFLAMSIPDRKSLIEKNRLCYACFAKHRIENCKSQFKCRVCKRSSHNTLIHPENTGVTPSPSPVPPTPANENTESVGQTPSITLANLCPKPSSTVVALLGTAKAIIYDVTGQPHFCRVVFDSGSQANLICSSLAARLGLPKRKGSYDLSGVGQATVHTKVKGSISVKVASCHNPNSFLHLEAAIIPQITSDLPTSPLPEQLLSQFSFLTLADPDFIRPASVDILLGVQAVLDSTLESPSPIKGFPCAVPTIFGYVIMGSAPVEPPPVLLTSLLAVSPDISIHTLERSIRAFWEQEEVEVSRPLSKADETCVQHFQDTISRDKTGRYIARLPFIDNIKPILGSTRNRALKRLFRLENQFQQNPRFRQLYNACLRDYVEQGHMVKAAKQAEYLLTHHGVAKDSGGDMKVRVVFNPSEKDPSGVSLNDSLLVGPKQQGDISELVTRFRTHRVAVKCDVKAMFRAIKLHPEDQDFLHFFWRFSPNDPVTEWQLTTVSFGVSSSPFTAQATLAKLVQDEGHKFPLAARALKQETYIDDIITGAPSEEEAQELCSQLVGLLREGGFELGKWASSSSTLFSSNPDIVNFPFDDSSSDGTKVLGIGWDPVTDAFRCHVDPTPFQATKKGVMSKIARLYDPNGYFAPTTFALKALVQQLWLLKSDWDQPIPDHLYPTWKTIEDELPRLEEIRIPRCLLPERYSHVQLLGFSDASELGMCAVLYLRVETDTGVQVSLIKSKTKVAPLKSWTIPRLELGAAHLLGRLLRSVQGLIDQLSITDITCFTDAMTTLAWLRTPPYKLKQFVCNRVIQIHDACPIAKWRHVPGKMNPADVGSRGIRPSKLIAHELWWHGPPFLLEPPEQWPVEPSLNFIGLPETKEAPILSFLSISDPSPIIALIEKSSSLLKLQRVVAYLLRLIHNSRLHATPSAATSRRSGPISPVEYKEALDVLITVTQAHHFREDIKAIKAGKECSRNLSALAPFLSPDGFLKVGGRITWAPISEKAKRPILIPKDSKLAQLLVDYYHEYTAHGGPRLVQSLLHQHYWISASRNLIRHRILKCVTCVRFAGQTNQPQMADLPPSRLSPGRAFTHTGVDFGGPFLIKTSNRRNAAKEKGYFALFICMTTRAVHIEVVSSLSTEACLAAIDRFIARRGLPSHFYSDNGRNFRGAAREISEIYSFLKLSTTEFENHLAKQQIIWVFNPPLAPNFGGAWEALIKRTKFHLKRVIGDRCLNFEEYQTLFARIEAILNSRPLTALPGSPNDPADCLTPGHFLVGGPLLSRPEENLLEENPDHLKRWRLLSHLVQSFWTRWRKEYLHSLQPRSKWTKKTPDLQEGAVVLLKSDNSAPTQWPLGRVEKTMPGTGGTVRVARVKTASGVLTRPTNKLVVLPTN